MHPRRFKFWKLDAFTDGKSSGNPAGLIWLENKETASETEMQRLATQVASGGFVTEVAFAKALEPAELELRYFSCEREVPFCGHATVAFLYHLLSTNPDFKHLSELSIITRRGRLRVENRIAVDDCVFIAAPQLNSTSIKVTATETAAALGLPLAELIRSNDDPAEQMPVVECGQKCLLVPLHRLSPLLECRPSYATLRALADRCGFEIIVLYTRETQFPERSFRTRVFAPAFGYLEDPATGSGNAALAHWLRRRHSWTSQTLLIEQGSNRENPNFISIRISADNTLQIGGKCIARIAGEYFLH